MFSVLGEVPLLTINLGNLHLVLYQSQVQYLLIAVVVSLGQSSLGAGDPL